MSHPSEQPSAPDVPPPAPFGASSTPSAPSSPAPTGSSAPGARGALAIVALVVAVVGAVFAAAPGAFAIGWVLLPVAFVLSIVALVRRSRRATAIAALVVSLAGTVIGAIAFVSSLATAVGAAIDETSEVTATSPSSPEDASEEADEPAPVDDAGTREAPLPLGTTVSSAEWAVTVHSVTLGATDAVLAENMFNADPAEGSEYILVDATVAYIGAEDGMPASVRIEYVTPDGVTVSPFDTTAVAPGALDITTTLYPDAEVRGNVALAVPSATAADGVVAVTPGVLADTVFVAVR